MKNCEHGEKFILGGKIDWSGLNYTVMVCIGCGKVLFSKENDNSGDIYEIEIYDDQGYNTFRMKKVFTPKYLNDKLWTTIMEKSNCYDMLPESETIDLPKLRKVLEEFKILGDEKDGM